MNNARRLCLVSVMLFAALLGSVAPNPASAAGANLLNPNNFASLGAFPTLAPGTYLLNASKDNANPVLTQSDAVTVISTGIFYDPTPANTTNKDEIAVFTYDGINVQSGVNIYAIQTTNTRPVAFLSKNAIVIDGVVSVSGADAGGSNGGGAGPGGGGGGGGGGSTTAFGSGGGGLVPGADGNTVPQGGTGGSVVAGGGGSSGGVFTDGGGGAFGGNGGDGDPSPGIGGTAYGDLTVALQGGSGGAGGSGSPSGFGGGGGGGGAGAIEIGAVNAITIGGEIWAIGGQGVGGLGQGGGGAGGGILVHGNSLTLSSASLLNAPGGRGGGTGSRGGGGGGGRVLILTEGGVLVSGSLATNVNVSGGNGGSNGQPGVKELAQLIDTTPPVITANIVGTLGNNGWYVSNVTVSWSVVDIGSAITSQTGCDSSTVSSDTAGVTFTCSATSTGGTASQSVTIKRDATAPTVTASGTKADNTPYAPGTWTNQNVTVTFTCSDGGSGVATCPGTQVISPDGTFTASGTATDHAGNSAEASFGPIQIDKSAPTIIVSATKADNTPYTPGTWTNQTVTVTFTCSDGGSGVATCPGTQVISPDGTFTASGTATDNVGNSAEASFGPIQIDKTDPTITFANRTAPNANGWNNSDVIVNWTCADATSGVVSATSSQTVSNEGSNQSASGTCSDLAGNSASDTQSGINIDKSAPTLNPVVSPNPVLLGGAATVTSNAADDLSGLASASCDPLDTSTIGAKTVSCTATDNADNSVSASASYAVIYNFTGFFSPISNPPAINADKAGSNIPVKFSLSGNHGLAIFAAGFPQSQQINCTSLTPIGSPVTISSPGNSGLKYEAGADQYHINWKTAKSWENSCRQLIVKLADGMEQIALFQFNGNTRSASAKEVETESAAPTVTQQVFLPLVNR